MVRLTFCLRRLPNLSLEEFQRYWYDRHGPLVRRHAAALRIKRYVQVHTTPHPVAEALAKNRHAPEPFDGVAELWFDSVEELRAAGATPEGRAAGKELVEDERRFIDHARSPVWLSVEKPIVE